MSMLISEARYKMKIINVYLLFISGCYMGPLLVILLGDRDSRMDNN